MTITEKFEEAVAKADTLTKRPSNQELLNLYAFYKQATEGDVNGERPSGFDFKGIAKYDAWEQLKGTTQDDAMQGYIDLMQSLLNKE
jgi:diazepam-binding inhibitor (GABA receptor modulator, acyl-CoA-binding protein)